MKKKITLKKIIYIVLIIILITPVLISVFGDKALKAGIETAGSKMLKVDVTLEDVSLSILSGSVELGNLIIANPEGYENKNLLEAGNIKVNIGLTSLMSDTIKIDDMIFDNITVVIEQKGFTNNLQEILDSLPKADKDAEKTDDADKTEKNLLIKNLEMNNITVKVKIIPLPGKMNTIPINLAPIKMTDLGTDNKMSFATLTAKMLAAIALGIAEQGVGIIPDEILEPMKNIIGTSSEVILKTGEEAIKGAGKILDVGKEAGKDISEGLRGLFKKKDK